MSLFLSLLAYLLIITWPVCLLLSYTLFTTPTRFLLQTFVMFPIISATSLIVYLIGLIVKYVIPGKILTADIRTFLLAFITQLFLQTMLFFMEFWPNTKYVISDENVNDDIFYLNSIILSNHSATPFDWVSVASFADYLERFQNSFIFMKKEFAYIPVIGWVSSLNSAKSLQRDWNKDKEYIKRLCQEFTNGKRYRLVTPWCWFSYPEGTRFTLEKMEKAQEFAKQRGYPIYKNLLQPRVKGFSYLTHHLYGVLGTVIDTTVVYHPKPAPNLQFWLQTRLSKSTHIHVRVYRQSELPSDLSELEQWLRDRWTEKDQLIETMKRNEIQCRVLERSPWRAIRYYIFWTALVLYLLFRCLFHVGLLSFSLLLVTALFPVAIVLIENSQHSDIK